MNAVMSSALAIAYTSSLSTGAGVSPALAGKQLRRQAAQQDRLHRGPQRLPTAVPTDARQPDPDGRLPVGSPRASRWPGIAPAIHPYPVVLVVLRAIRGSTETAFLMHTRGRADAKRNRRSRYPR